MGDFFAKFKQVIAELSLARKITMIAIIGITVGMISFLMHIANRASMEPLFTNLNSDDMGSIVSRLDSQNIRYQIDQDARTIMVPSGDVLELRMKMAEEGLPRLGGVGFELFDRGGFGMSEFEQRINYQRALEGELSRTIRDIREVESARVHLVLPEKSLFAAASKSSTASVILKLGANQMLPGNTVSAITNLVSSAVEGLTPDQVTVVDNVGRLLTSAGGDPSVMAGGQAFDQKLLIERSFERRIVELLSPVVGMGKIIAKVSVDMDFTRTESTDEIVDPSKSAVLNESRSSTNSTDSGGGSAGGVAGAAANLPGGAGGGAGGGGGGGSSDQSTEEIRYAVSKSVMHKISPMGEMRKLSVAILVDGKYQANEEGGQVYEARSPEELKQIEDLVSSAMGFSTERGDSIKVQSLEFQTSDEQMAEAEGWYQQRTMFGFIVKVVGNVVVVLMGLLVLFFVIRPMMQQWKGVQVGPDGMPLLEGQVSADLGQLVRTDPTAAANAIRQWIK